MGERIWSEDGHTGVANSANATSPLPSDIQKAREIANRALGRFMTAGNANAVESVAALIAAALATVREETVEECAKLADGHTTGQIRGVSLGPEATPAKIADFFYKFAARQIAQGIRESLPSPPSQGRKGQ